MVVLLFSFIFLFPPLLVHGQAVTVSGPITVNEARNLPHDSWVTLTGNIVNALPGGRNYTFRDSSSPGAGSSEIIAEIDWNVWRGLNVSGTDRVEISGEVRINRGQVSINVRAISGAQSSNVRAGQAVTLNRPISVDEARMLPNDSWVTLNGNIVNALPGGRHYTFLDSEIGSGEIMVEIDQRVWRGAYVGPSDRVEISGEVRVNRGISTIIVRAIRVI